MFQSGRSPNRVATPIAYECPSFLWETKNYQISRSPASCGYGDVLLAAQGVDSGGRIRTCDLQLTVNRLHTFTSFYCTRHFTPNQASIQDPREFLVDLSTSMTRRFVQVPCCFRTSRSFLALNYLPACDYSMKSILKIILRAAWTYFRTPQFRLRFS